MADLLQMPQATARPLLAARGLSVHAGERVLLRQVDLQIRQGEVTGVIGPSGAGKSTLLKALNRTAELESPPLAVRGAVEIDGVSIYDRSVDADQLRQRIGILFQQPVVFPMSVRANVLFGVRHHERLNRRQAAERLEETLGRAALWNELEDRLDDPANTLSLGQQQRLCMARTLAVRPEVILMDEPTSALDPHSTEVIEELIAELKSTHAIVLVTHDLAQARRVADVIACICPRGDAGELVEVARCDEVFTSPRQPETVKYLRQEGRL